MGFFRVAHRYGRCQKAPPLPKICHISYNDETWHSDTLHKEDPKNIWITWHTPWILLTSAFFHRKSANFAISRNTDIDWILVHNFQSLKIVLINVVTILMMSVKMATPGLHKIKVFWKKGYDVIIFVNDVTNKTLSRDSNYIVDVVMWPKFGNSSISMREVIITLSL